MILLLAAFLSISLLSKEVWNPLHLILSERKPSVKEADKTSKHSKESEERRKKENDIMMECIANAQKGK
jgi:F0F1-type ATP synthase membrane subunit b/b'